MKEKIAKLLASKNRKDVEIGKELLLQNYREQVEAYRVKISDSFIFLFKEMVERIIDAKIDTDDRFFMITLYKV